MNRYSNINIKKKFDNKRVYVSTVYPSIPQSSSDIIITSSETDYLDTLAFKYYGDPTFWWIIALVNNVGKGRLSITPGTRLRIPTNINDIIVKFNELNKV
jgi:nucleoid-associated protein YgaU